MSDKRCGILSAHGPHAWADLNWCPGSMTSVPPTQPPAAKCDYCDQRATTLAGDTNGVLVCEDHVRLFAEREIAAAIDATQPPAADETDASTPRPWPENAWPTAAELADWLSRCTSDERLSYADHSLATAQRAARCVDEQHALRLVDLDLARERVRVVEGERDALIEERNDLSLGWVEEVARAEKAEAERDRAEAAHRALQAAVEALADEWDRDDERDMTAGWAADRLLALLAGGAR